jgi:hypothetical protein
MAASLWLTVPGHAAAAAAAASLPAPKLSYASAFAGTPAVADPKPIDWRQSNALVGRLQGHAGHLRAPSGAARP